MTRNCGGAVRKVFPDVDEYVDTMVTREDVPIVKPDPSHPEAVLERLGVNRRDALLVGDHPSDIQAGRSAGVQTVGVLSGRINKDELENAGADFVVGDIREILPIVSEMKVHVNRCEGR
jgi:phosphoglycolate phosphatase